MSRESLCKASRYQRFWVLPLGGLVLWGIAACSAQAPVDASQQVSPSTMVAAPESVVRALSPGAEAEIAHGRYLVQLLGCGTCHTDGALTGQPRTDRLLAGSRVGIAYSSPLLDENPGVVFPPNLTPDQDTGIGRWSAQDIVRFLRSGMDPVARPHLPVMPWPAYASLNDEDASAIAHYLRSLAPVRHRVPANVGPGQATTAEFVYFGVYRSR